MFFNCVDLNIQKVNTNSKASQKDDPLTDDDDDNGKKMIPELLLALSGIPGDVIEHQPYRSPRCPDRFGVSKKAVDAGVVLDGEIDALERKCCRWHTRCSCCDDSSRRKKRKGEAECARARTDERWWRVWTRCSCNRTRNDWLHLEQKILDGSIEPNANAIEDFLGEFSISLVGTTEALKE